MNTGRLFVLSAPSGAGKSTLIEKILPRLPGLRYSVSCTSRPARDGEKHGVDYFFLGEEVFRRMIDQGLFLEWKEVHGNLYGTPVKPVQEALESGHSMILDIDVAGAREVFEKIRDAVGIFISPPDMAALEHRLRSRGTDSEESIRIRLANAVKEMESAYLFCHRIVNDNLEEAADQLEGIIVRESCGTS